MHGVQLATFYSNFTTPQCYLKIGSLSTQNGAAVFTVAMIPRSLARYSDNGTR